MRATVTLSDDPTLALIGWAAVRRGNHLHIALSTTLSPRRRERARLAAMTDAEHDCLALTGHADLRRAATPAADILR